MKIRLLRTLRKDAEDSKVSKTLTNSFPDILLQPAFNVRESLLVFKREAGILFRETALILERLQLTKAEGNVSSETDFDVIVFMFSQYNLQYL